MKYNNTKMHSPRIKLLRPGREENKIVRIRENRKSERVVSNPELEVESG